jgi:putative ABC transport system permease protein
VDLGESIRTALVQISARKVRTFLTMLGVIIGVGSVIAMSGMAKGAADKVRRQVVDRRYADLTIYPVSHVWGMTELSTGFSENQLTLRQVRALRHELKCARMIAPQASGRVQSRYRDEYTPLRIMPAWTDFFQMYRLNAAYGRIFTESETQSRAPVIVLGLDVAKQIGDPETIIGDDVYLNGRKFHVIGVLEHTDLRLFRQNPGMMGIVPFEIATSGLTTIRNFNFVRINLQRGWSYQQGAEEIERLLRRERRLVSGQSNTFTIRSDAEMAVAEEEVAQTFGRLLISISAVSLIVGGFGIMAVMLVSVRERTQEIGVRRAVGATRRDLTVQFLIEAAILSTVGGLIGIGMGIGLTAVMSQYGDWALDLSFRTIGVAIGASTTIGVVFGVIPAIMASRLDPVDALRHE